MIAIAGGLVAGLLFAGVLEYLDRSMRSEDDVLAALNLPVLATVPLVRESVSRWQQRKLAISVSAAVAVLAGAGFVAWRLLR